jgi:pSer/pThr/pTyr-binding forkhead associated (FHA) protein
MPAFNELKWKAKELFIPYCPHHSESKGRMDWFHENCGISSLNVSVEQLDAAGPPTVHCFPGRTHLLIGRDERNDLRLDDASVSKRHCYLQAVAGRIFCVDLASRTGLRWPSGPRPLGWLEWDEPLRIGETVIRIARPTRAEGVDAFPSDEDLTVLRPGPTAVFDVIKGTNTPARWQMNHLLALVGGAAQCKVRLGDARVSRFHCALVRGPLGASVVDLLSRGGTQVNGRLAAQARLADGDLLEVGPYVMRIRYQSASRRRTMLAAPAVRAIVAAPPALPPALLNNDLLPPLFNEFQQMQQQMMDQFQQTLLMMAEMFSTLHKEQSALVREELEHLRRLTSELNALQAEKTRQPAAVTPPALIANGQAAGNPPTGAAPKVERTAEAEPAPPADIHDLLTRRIDALQAERQGRWQKLLKAVMGN